MASSWSTFIQLWVTVFSFLVTGTNHGLPRQFNVVESLSMTVSYNVMYVLGVGLLVVFNPPVLKYHEKHELLCEAFINFQLIEDVCIN